MKKIFSGILIGAVAAFALHAELKVPTVTVPTVSVPTASVPEASVPEALVPTTDLVPTANVPAASIPATSEPETALPTALVPAAEDLNAPIVQGMAFRDLLRTLFRDQRGLLHDRTAHVQSETFRKWVEIYRNYKPETFAAYPVPEGVRMIAEVRSSADLSRLPATLAFYRKEGYNAVLLSLTGKETPADAENVCKLILSSGMRIYFAFSPAGGDGELAASVFPDPGPLADLLRITSMYADGYLLHWRRTSSHYFLHDAPWDAWMIRTVRSGNAKITLLGEIYLGMTAESGEKVRFTVNTPSGVSGAVLNGGGFYGVSAEGMVQEAGKHSALPLWAVILGEKPRYLQTGKKSFAEHLKIKKALEREYLQAGCAGTITLHSDTSRDNLSEWEVPDALK